MKLSKIVEKLEEYMDYFTYGYEINSIILDARYKYKINITEYGPDGIDGSYPLYTDEDGNIFNDEGNLIDFAKDVYDYDQEVLQWIDRFEEKWRA